MQSADLVVLAQNVLYACDIRSSATGQVYPFHYLYFYYPSVTSPTCSLPGLVADGGVFPLWIVTAFVWRLRFRDMGKTLVVVLEARCLWTA